MKVTKQKGNHESILEHRKGKKNMVIKNIGSCIRLFLLLSYLHCVFMIKAKMIAISDVLLNTVHPISQVCTSTDSTTSDVNFPVGWICSQTACRCGVSVTVHCTRPYKGLSVSGVWYPCGGVLEPVCYGC